MKDKLTNRDRQALATKEKLYKTGIQLFKKHGYENVSVDDIVKECAVSIGTFYRYYESKMALYMEMFINAQDFFEDFKRIDYEKELPRVVLLRYFKQYVQLNESGGIEFLGEILAVSNRKFLKNQDFENDVVEIITNYQKRHAFPACESPQDISDMLFTIARGVLLDWCYKKGSYDVYERMDHAISSILDSYELQLEREKQ